MTNGGTSNLDDLTFKAIPTRFMLITNLPSPIRAALFSGYSCKARSSLLTYRLLYWSINTEVTHVV